MRLIGTIHSKAQATKFSDFLYLKGIENKVELDKQNDWDIWVISEDHLEEAKQLLDEYIADPNNSKFYVAPEKIIQKQELEEKEMQAYHDRIRGPSKVFRAQIGILSIVLIITSIIITIATYMGENTNILNFFLITKSNVMGNRIFWNGGLPEIMHGEIWRLITPIFIHFGILHILFNMLWMKDLGTIIEVHERTWYLGIQVIVIGVLSNLGQYYVGGPMFGGMSGVVYGLFGYIWIRGRMDFTSGYSIPTNTVVMMIGWFVLCLVGVIPHVANTAHGVGLGVGAIWGFISAKYNLQKSFGNK